MEQADMTLKEVTSTDITLAEQVALYTKRLDALHAVAKRMAARARFILPREEWLAENPGAPNRHLFQGIVDQAEKKQGVDRAEGTALMRELGDVFWQMIHDPVFPACYQRTVMRVPSALSLGGEQIDLWDWELRIVAALPADAMRHGEKGNAFSEKLDEKDDVQEAEESGDARCQVAARRNSAA